MAARGAPPLGERLVLFSFCGTTEGSVDGISLSWLRARAGHAVQGTPCSSDFITTPVVKDNAFRATGPLYKSILV